MRWYRDRQRASPPLGTPEMDRARAGRHAHRHRPRARVRDSSRRCSCGPEGVRHGDGSQRSSAWWAWRRRSGRWSTASWRTRLHPPRQSSGLGRCSPSVSQRWPAGAPAARLVLDERAARVVTIGAAVAFAAYTAVVVLVDRRFAVAIAFYLPAAIFLLVAFLLAARRGDARVNAGAWDSGSPSSRRRSSRGASGYTPGTSITTRCTTSSRGRGSSSCSAARGLRRVAGKRECFGGEGERGPHRIFAEASARSAPRRSIDGGFARWASNPAAVARLTSSGWA